MVIFQGAWHRIGDALTGGLRLSGATFVEKETIRSPKPVTIVNVAIDVALVQRHALLQVTVGDSRMPGAAGGANDCFEPYPSRRRR